MIQQFVIIHRYKIFYRRQKNLDMSLMDQYLKLVMFFTKLTEKHLFFFVCIQHFDRKCPYIITQLSSNEGISLR